MNIALSTPKVSLFRRNCLKKPASCRTQRLKSLCRPWHAELCFDSAMVAMFCRFFRFFGKVQCLGPRSASSTKWTRPERSQREVLHFRLVLLVPALHASMITHRALCPWGWSSSQLQRPVCQQIDVLFVSTLHGEGTAKPPH